ncbi:hypothetical protein [Phosphitispora fastidiosa]|uniref:hypothetical protein n=1 Tax=Phosphitispora fastidiosa TaxID=2837202 RepID=UPI001E3E69F3|nr:hypothetical protein [Phosphitispora fastidiosa]MBU7007736.1 rRNA-processing protein FCF1 [Phosphitispora fastidiosa]
MLEKIKNEIEKTGFPLELRVADLLQGKDYYVAHSLYYVDEDEGKAREVDLRALKNAFTYNSDQSVRTTVRNCLIVECKKSASKPWVFLTSPKACYDADFYDLPFLPMQDFVILELEKLENTHPFALREVMGRSYFEAFKNGETGETIFKALTTVTKATSYFMKTRFGTDGTNNFCFYYPIIVFDGQLFKGELVNGRIEVEEVNSLLVSFFYPSKGYEFGRFAIPVIKECELTKFLDQLDECLQVLAENIDSYITNQPPKDTLW